LSVNIKLSGELLERHKMIDKLQYVAIDTEMPEVSGIYSFFFQVHLVVIINKHIILRNKLFKKYKNKWGE